MLLMPTGPRRHDTKPRIHEVAADLRARIDASEFAPGEKLPSTRMLAEHYELSPPAIARVVAQLKAEGVVTARQGAGVFVRELRRMSYRPQEEFRRQPLSREMDQFITQLDEEGRVATQTIEAEVIDPDQEVRKRLQLREGQQVVVRRRIRSIDGERFNINDSYFPLDLVQGSVIVSSEDIPRGANAILTDLGYEQVRALDEIYIRMPNPDEVSRLQLGPGTPVGIHLCTGYAADGRPVRTVVNVLPGDRHVITYERTKAPVRRELRVRAATSADLTAVTSLLEQASAWLRKRGSDQWQYPPRHDRIAQNVAAGECYLVEDDGVPIATITLDNFADPDFWTAAEAAEPSLYVHRMAVRRDASGVELGSAMLDWASQQAKNRGLKWLRLDAWRDNSDLIAFYSTRGFQHLRTVDAQARRSGALFQRLAGNLRGAGPVLVSLEEHSDADE